MPYLPASVTSLCCSYRCGASWELVGLEGVPRTGGNGRPRFNQEIRTVRCCRWWPWYAVEIIIIITINDNDGPTILVRCAAVLINRAPPQRHTMGIMDLRDPYLQAGSITWREDVWSPRREWSTVDIYGIQDTDDPQSPVQGFYLKPKPAGKKFSC